MAKVNGKVVITYHESLTDVNRNFEDIEGLAVWVEEPDGTKFVTSAPFMHYDGQDKSQEKEVISYTIFKKAWEWHNLHGYPIEWR